MRIFLVECCNRISIEGLYNGGLHGTYKSDGSIINSRQLYLLSTRGKAIWFDGYEWRLGDTTDVNKGIFRNTGYLYSNQETACPDFRELTQELVNDEWVDNTKIVVKCIAFSDPAKEVINNEWVDTNAIGNCRGEI